MAKWKRRETLPPRRQWVETDGTYPYVKTLAHSPDPPLTRRDEKLLLLYVIAIALVGFVGAVVWLLLD